MKRIVLALIVIGLSTAHAFSMESPVPSPVISSFQSAFPNANNVKWEDRNNLFVASFEMNNHQLQAYYDKEGTFMVTSEVINLTQLPVGLADAFKAKFTNYQALAVYRMESEDGVSYSAVIEKNNKRFVVKSAGKKWSVLGLCKLF